MTSRPPQDRIASHGRGGAGNLMKDEASAQAKPVDLVTPTLKSQHYTTGRGGSGNMARNDPQHPEIARASQDVDAPSHRDHDGPRLFGRGGGGNIAKTATSEEHQQRHSEDEKRGEAAAGKGVLDKGKDLLSKLGGKK